MREDKQKICDLLCEVLKATRDQEDLISLVYEKDEAGNETVTSIYNKGGSRVVNVTIDSGIAMIRDIMKSL